MIPYVMDDSKTLAEIVADTSNGLGRLAECQDLSVTEGLSGEYVASMTIPKAAYNSGLIHRGGIIKAKANDSDSPQLFRIVRFKDTLSSGLIECDLEHISYDLNKTIMYSTYERVGATSVSGVLQIFNGTAPTCSVAPGGIFTATSNMPTSTTIRHWDFTPPPKTVRQNLLSEDGICAFEGWQMHWDNLNFELRDRRGTDKTDSAVISYGKNVLDFSNEEDVSDIYDGVLGFAYVPSKWTRPTIGDVKPIVSGTTPKHLLMLDLSENARDMATQPTASQVNTWANTWIANNNPSVPKVALDIDLISLEDTGEYETLSQLEGLELGDTITVKIDDYSVNATVTEVTYDSLTERYTEIKLGNYQPSLTNTLMGLVGENSTSLFNTQQEYNATFQSMKTQLLFDTYQAHPASDWGTGRYNQYEISGNGFIIIMVNAYADTNASYGNLTAYVQHSFDGSSWDYDAFTAYRHDQTSASSTDGISVTVPIAVTDGELIRACWRISKEDKKICRVKMLGIGVTATETVTGGSL